MIIEHSLIHKSNIGTERDSLHSPLMPVGAEATMKTAVSTFGVCISLLFLMLICSSCNRRDDANQETISKDVMPGKHSPMLVNDIPHYPAKVFCNNLKYGTSNGAVGAMGAAGKLTCGHPSAVSEITWTFIGHVTGKDEYRFERRFPVDRPTTSSAVRDVEFVGERITVFEDAFQKITIVPLEDTGSEQADRADLATLVR